MLGLLDAFSTLTPLINLGATGVMLIWVWRLFVKKDKKSYEMIDAQNEERKAMYEAHSELIREVTTALVDKNNTDDKMAVAITRLADEMREIRAVLERQQPPANQEKTHEEA